MAGRIRQRPRAARRPRQRRRRALAAVQRGPQGLFVWMVTAKNLAEPRRIEVGPTYEGLTVVASGLSFETASPQQPPWRHARHQLAQALGFMLPVVPARPG